ncbi:hypothetical protein_gp156 [Bacillus phage vB_BceM_WH1]|nr:hypothetical protein_gp156 [Bacillus phage vB_BceM_WH1]
MDFLRMIFVDNEFIMRAAFLLTTWIIVGYSISRVIRARKLCDIMTWLTIVTVSYLFTTLVIQVMI